MNLALLIIILIIIYYNYYYYYIELFGINSSFKKIGKKSGLKNAGKDIENVGKDAGKGIDKGFKDAGKDIDKGFKDAGKGIVNVGKDIGKGFKDLGKLLDPIAQILKKIREFLRKLGLYIILIICCPCITFLLYKIIFYILTRKRKSAT